MIYKFVINIFQGMNFAYLANFKGLKMCEGLEMEEIPG